MARVYASLGARLEADLRALARDTRFSQSFVGESEVSKAVAAIGSATDLSVIEGHAVYGPTETARFEEVDKQLTALKGKSQKESLVALKQARSDVDLLANKVTKLGDVLNSEKQAARSVLSLKAKESSDAATSVDTAQSKSALFTAV